MRTGYWTPRRVFSVQQEDSLAEYLKRAADLFYGLSTKEVRMRKVLKHCVGLKGELYKNIETVK